MTDQVTSRNPVRVKKVVRKKRNFREGLKKKYGIFHNQEEGSTPYHTFLSFLALTGALGEGILCVHVCPGHYAQKGYKKHL